MSHASYFFSLAACTVGRLRGRRKAYMYTDVTGHLLYILLATTYTVVSWGFIEACGTCSPINTYYHIMIFKSKCLVHSILQIWVVYHLHRKKFLSTISANCSKNGKFCSDWPHIINSKNSKYFTKV